MKKTLVIVILAVYIASIAVVNFFGLEIKVFDGVTYVEGIECKTVTLHNENSIILEPEYYDKNGIPVFVFDFIPASEDAPYTEDPESIISNPNAIQINYEVLPHLADETGVKFVYDENSMAGSVVFHELSRTFVFLKPNRIYTITIKAIDGSNKSTQIKIMGYLE